MQFFYKPKVTVKQFIKYVLHIYIFIYIVYIYMYK